MLPVLKVSATGEVHIQDAVERLAQELELTNQERSELLPSGKQGLFANRVHWAKTYLHKAGCVKIVRRGWFTITARGQDLLAKNLKELNTKLLKQFPEFLEFKSDRDSGDTGDSNSVESASTETSEATPDEAIRIAWRRLENEIAADVLSRLRAMSPVFFERTVVRLLFAMGYGGTEQALDSALTSRSGDGGIDGVINQDPLGLDQVYVQAKRYGEANQVGSGAIRDFVGSLDQVRASKGLFISTSGFTTDAKGTAERATRRIILIDGKRLASLMVKHDVGCRVDQTIQIKRIDEEFFEEA
jgi:restriction system protein